MDLGSGQIKIHLGFWLDLGKAYRPLFDRCLFLLMLMVCRTTTAWMGTLSLGTLLCAYLFKKYTVQLPDHEAVMAGQIRAEREQQQGASKA